MNRFRFLFAVLTVLLLPQPAFSDELRPGYLEMRQTSPGAYNLLFKIPARGGGFAARDLRQTARRHPRCSAAAGVV